MVLSGCQADMHIHVCVGGALLLAALACCLVVLRRRHKVRKAQQSLAAGKGPYDPGHATPTQRGGFSGWLFGHSSAASSGMFWLSGILQVLCIQVSKGSKQQLQAEGHHKVW